MSKPVELEFDEVTKLPKYLSLESYLLSLLEKVDMKKEAKEQRYLSEESYKCALAASAFNVIDDYGADMFPEIKQCLEASIAQNMLPETIAKLGQLFENNNLHKTEKLYICDHEVAGVTVRMLVRAEVLGGLLKMQLAD